MSDFLQHTTIKRRGGYKVSPSLLLPLFFPVSSPSNPCSSSSQSPRREGRTTRPRRSGRRSPPRPRSCADGPRPSASGGPRCWPRGGTRRSRASRSPRSSTPGRGCWTAGARDTSAGRAAPCGRVADGREEGRLASDPQPGLGCVETLGGRVCELPARRCAWRQTGRSSRPSAPRPGRTRRGGGSSRSSGGRRSCGGIRRRRTGSRR
jgi:hypothetical protein